VTVPCHKDNIFIGSNGTKDGKFGGILDELALWNRVLTQDEFKIAMGAPTPAVRLESKLPAFWGELKVKH